MLILIGGRAVDGDGHWPFDSEADQVAIAPSI